MDDRFVWYLYYPTISVVFLDEVNINVKTALINAIFAGLFGIVMAQFYGWLHTEA